MSALEILYGGQFTLSTQLIKSLPPLFKSELVLRGVTFLRNCGTASVGKYKKLIWFYQLSWQNQIILNWIYFCMGLV